jgi:hypothetical protein
MRTLDTLAITARIGARRARRAIMRGLRLPTMFDRIRLCFILMIILGPLFAVVERYNQQRVEEILRQGTSAEAAVTGTRITSGRNTSYFVDLAWRAPGGAQHRVEQMTVSAGYFNQVTRVSLPKVRIKYLADREVSRRTVALLDDPSWTAQGTRMIPGWLLVSLVGLAGTALMTLWRNWRRRRAAQMA